MRRSFSILHLSDPQFGRNHLFGNANFQVAEHGTELGLRVAEDVAKLQKSHGFTVDLLVVSGDIVETGAPSEFELAAQFVDELSSAFELPSANVCLVPGNHDISWGHCEAYFATCRANEQDPISPYAKKWETYHSFLSGLGFDISGRVAGDRLFELQVRQSLGLALVLIDSTFAESHLEKDHYGFVGENQLKQIEIALEPVDEQLVRIAALHHNLLPVGLESERLRDADEFVRRLGQHLDVVLHGHTHEGSSYFLRDGTLVLPTGSAAVDTSARNAEVPNQYQVLLVDDTELVQLGRRYEPDLKRWSGDNRVSADLNSWQRAFRLDRIEALGPATKLVHQPFDAWRGDDATDQQVDLSEDTFLDRVREVCQLRYGNARLTDFQPVGRSPAYVRATWTDGPVVRQRPIGAWEGDLVDGVAASFHETVHRRYESVDTTMTSTLVVGGKIAPGVKEKYARRHLEILSFSEFQGILDFDAYRAALLEALDEATGYNPSSYVPQRYSLQSGDEEVGALKYFANKLSGLNQYTGLILGDFGAGKTFLSKQIAREILQNERQVPLLVELGRLEKAATIEQLLVQHFTRMGETQVDLGVIMYMIRQGLLVLVFDGFDELAQRVSYERASEHLSGILSGAGGSSKMIITSRRQHFVADDQVLTEYGSRVSYGSELVFLKPFDEDDIGRYVLNRFNDSEGEAQVYLELMGQLADLSELARNPRMLGFICDLPPSELRSAIDRQHGLSAASLYDALITRWLSHEVERVDYRGGSGFLRLEHRLRAAMHVATSMWVSGNQSVELADLDEEVRAALLPMVDVDVTGDQATHQIGSGSLLVRAESRSFRFIHLSVLEWLVAKSIALDLDEKDGGSATAMMSRASLTGLMADFLCDLASTTELSGLVATILSQDSGHRLARENALLLAERGVSTAGSAELNLRQVNLQGRSLRNLPLANAELRGSRLYGADLRGADLASADLSHADLRRADLRSASVREAIFDGARLEAADLRGADLEGATFAGADLRRARLDTTHMELLEDVRTAGSSFGNALALQPQFSPCNVELSCVLATTFDAVLVGGTFDGRVIFWDVRIGQIIRSQTISDARIVALQQVDDNGVRPDSSLRVLDSSGRVHRLNLSTFESVLVGSFDVGVKRGAFDLGGTSRLALVTDTGKCLIRGFSRDETEFEVSSEGVSAVAWSSTGSSLGVGSRDGLIEVLETELFTSRFHANFGDGVPTAIALGANAQITAAGGFDGRVVVWRTRDGAELASDEHSAGVAALHLAAGESVAHIVFQDGVLRELSLMKGGGVTARRSDRHELGYKSPVVAFGPTGSYSEASSDGSYVAKGTFERGWSESYRAPGQERSHLSPASALDASVHTIPTLLGRDSGFVHIDGGSRNLVGLTSAGEVAGYKWAVAHGHLIRFDPSGDESWRDVSPEGALVEVDQAPAEPGSVVLATGGADSGSLLGLRTVFGFGLVDINNLEQGIVFNEDLRTDLSPETFELGPGQMAVSGFPTQIRGPFLAPSRQGYWIALEDAILSYRLDKSGTVASNRIPASESLQDTALFFGLGRKGDRLVGIYPDGTAVVQKRKSIDLLDPVTEISSSVHGLNMNNTKVADASITKDLTIVYDQTGKVRVTRGGARLRGANVDRVVEDFKCASVLSSGIDAVAIGRRSGIVELWRLDDSSGVSVIELGSPIEEIYPASDGMFVRTKDRLLSAIAIEQDKLQIVWTATQVDAELILSTSSGFQRSDAMARHAWLAEGLCRLDNP